MNSISNIIDKVSYLNPEKYISISVDFNSYVRFDKRRPTQTVWTLYIQNEMNQEFPTLTALEAYVNGLLEADPETKILTAISEVSK